jgi:uncharacterized coiled-coil DUF342 family protein
MDTKKAIEKANEIRKSKSEDEFQDKVETLLYRIETASETLRSLKKELSDLEYETPEDLTGE